MHKRAEHYLIDLQKRYPCLNGKVINQISEVFDCLKDSFSQGRKLLVCGNGGSASDADHIAGELMKGFCNKRTLPQEWQEKLGDAAYNFLQNGLPTIPLANLTGLISAYNNDCNPEFVYAQLTWVLGQPNDTLLCLSTSGNSKNILQAAKVAKAKGMKSLGLTGQSGGRLKDVVDACICVPETETYKIQELHLPVYHSLSLMLEAHFFGNAEK